MHGAAQKPPSKIYPVSLALGSGTDCNDKYRVRKHHKVCYKSLKEIEGEPSILNFWRSKDSYTGISSLSYVTDLTATSVDEGFFEEICSMPNLSSLIMDTVKVEDLSPLAKLKKLKYLKVVKLKPTKNIEVLTAFPALEKLWIDESKEITDYSFLSGAKKIVALGVEGDIWTKQKIDTLAPFSNLDNLEALFLSSVQLKDKNLDYLASNPRLKHLWCARFAPRKSFESLRKLMPNLDCKWCDNYEV